MKQIVDRLLVRYMHRCILCIIVSTPMSLWAQTTGEMSTTDRLNELSVGLNTVWMLLAAMLVFFMQPGFALVEAGFTRMKNTANILMKNLVDFMFGALLFWSVGFGLMFGLGDFVGMPHFMNLDVVGNHINNGLPIPQIRN